MNEWVCLFRGINVGGRHILPMQDLVSILQDLGCTNVATYIQSGNVVFQHDECDTRSLEDLISKEVGVRYGFEPRVLIMPVRDLEAAIDANPYPGANEQPKAVHLYFLAQEAHRPDLQKMQAQKASSEEFQLIGRVFYLYAPDGIGRSKLAANVEKLLGVPATARNWRTVLKLLQMAKSAKT